MKKYTILTAKSEIANYLEALDAFEDDINEFLETQDAELVGGISMVAVGETIYFAQALLIEKSGSGEYGKSRGVTPVRLAVWEGKPWKEISERFPFERYGD